MVQRIPAALPILYCKSGLNETEELQLNNPSSTRKDPSTAVALNTHINQSTHIPLTLWSMTSLDALASNPT
jgi:hypothetical protein